MKFSVIIPMHNAEQWVAQALDSIEAQTVKPFEIIVIADSCTDQSIDIVRARAMTIQIIECSCRNAAAARNLGIKASAGDAIALLDADDYWLDHHLESAEALLSKGNDVAYISGFNRILWNGKILQPTLASIEHPTTGISPLDYITIREKNFVFGHLTVVYLKSRLEEVGLFDETMLSRHDFDLWLRVIAGKTWCCDPEPTAVYRVGTPGAITSHTARGHYFELRCIVNNLPDYRKISLYQNILHIAARRAMTTGLVDGSPEDYERAKQLAWRYMTLHDKLLFLFLGQRAGLLSKIIVFRRKRMPREV